MSLTEEWMRGLTAAGQQQPSFCQSFDCLYSLAWLTALVGHFWHITDFHFDPDYSVHGNPEYMCRVHAQQDVQYGSDFRSGKYGDFLCDSPWTLVNSSISAMKKINPDPDFILWTGDNLVHPSKGIKGFPSWDEVYKVQNRLSRRLRSAFPKAKILPSLGNHDNLKANILPPGKSPIYRGFLMEGGWDALLPPSAWNTFISGGYYSILVRPRLLVVSLNTMLWTSRNPQLADLEDPAGQFQWLEQVLEKAQNDGNKVYVIGHMPPGFYVRARTTVRNTMDLYENFSDRYINLVIKYQGTIAGQFFGHQHVDSFLMIKDKHGYPVNSVLLAPSVTPWFIPDPRYPGFYAPVNPSIRLFAYDRSSSVPVNYEQYFLNLTKANERAQSDEEPEWEELYSFNKTYNLPDLSPTSMQLLYEKLSTQDDVFSTFFNFTTAGKHLSSCDSFCRRAHLCSIAHVFSDDYYKCIEAVDVKT